MKKNKEIKGYSLTLLRDFPTDKKVYKKGEVFKTENEQVKEFLIKNKYV